MPGFYLTEGNAQDAITPAQKRCKDGDRVKTGTKLCILEAMKMENEITSPKNGTVTHIHIDSGDNVEKGNLLMEISD